jgi:cell division protein FtsI (penicillin-binding protein 3)
LDRAELLANNRLRILARICLGWGVFISLRLIELQIIDHEKYSRLADNQHEREVELQAARGSIFDRNGQALAMSTPVQSVCVNPMRLPDPGTAADLLSQVLDLDRETLVSRLATAIDNRRGFLWVKRKITTAEEEKLRRFGFDWIEFRTESSRFYPKKQLLAHVMGSVDYEERGNAGIEQSLNEDLQGRPGIMRTKADVRHNVFEQEVETEAQPGSNITLTIDERIQYIAERELAGAVKEHKANTGSLVVMNPMNGEILALASYPTYDPNIPPKSKDDMSNRRNLAVTAPFEPGSVFKVFTLAAALDTTRLTPASSFHCGNGRMTLFRRVIHDAKPNGMLTMADILAKSSNIGAIKIALEVGNERMYEYVRKFGFGQRTGLPLPGESGGILRRLNRWIPSSIGSIAMGHELSATTVQLARGCSVIANGGYLVTPSIVMGKQDSSSGEVERTQEPKPVQVIRPENAIKMRLMMERVVSVKGTGSRAKLHGYSAGGKTGSAQIYDFTSRVYTHRYNGSFMGFAPVNNPRVVVVVTLNGTPSGNRGFGGVVAAPVFKTVASAALRLMDVPRDVIEPESSTDEDDEPPPADLAIAGISQPPEEEESETTPAVVLGPERPAHLAVAGATVPNFYGKTKRAVLQQSLAMGVRVQIAGSGIARTQDPPPGVAIRPGERVKVTFAP